jgi:uncharacterized membrane protein
MRERIFNWTPRELQVPVSGLLFACGLCVAVLLARVAYTWHLRQLYLAWNLLLACVPVLFAVAFIKAQERGEPLRRKCLIALAWLVFLPNAPYIVTDLVHLQSPLHPKFWIDLLLILLFAWSGAFAGFLSLFIMHRHVVRRAGALPGWLFVGIVALLCGVGVYLGRFERWNSWDLLLQPHSILTDLWDLATEHGRKFVLLFATIIMIGYITLYSLVRMSVALARDGEGGSHAET